MDEIKYPQFQFDSELTHAIIELERARGDLGRGTTPPYFYLQLTELFQLLTSIMSARIEGNRTSILDAVSGVAGSRTHGAASSNEGVKEILNIQAAVKFVDESVSDNPINHLFVRELHRLVVQGLTREGDPTPGAYRLGEVSIGQSVHRPPFPTDVPDFMTSLIRFIEQDVEPEKQLLQTAVAHHRFVWIHPFGNGNGRTARLLTYAMLVRQGFTSGVDYRAVNPTAVFGANREAYYDNLEVADSLKNDDIVTWCTYVLDGLNADIKKVGRLSDANFVTNQILIPAIERLRNGGRATAAEARALMVAARTTTVKASDLNQAFPGSPSTRSQAIRRLVDRDLLRPTELGARAYHLAFTPNDLTVHIINRLDSAGLLPTILSEDPI
jgi:Fic family protein